MARVLYLMRHAKSSWKKPLPDHDRPLSKRGKRAAVAIGEELARLGVRPERVISSTAKRARSTARRVMKALEEPREILRLEPELYGADAAEILDLIRRLDDGERSVLLVGHNPAVSDTAVLLSGERRLDWLPTGAVAGIRFDVDSWRDVAPGSGRLILELRPRELEG